MDIQENVGVHCVRGNCPFHFSNNFGIFKNLFAFAVSSEAQKQLVCHVA